MTKSTLPLLKAASCLALVAFFLPSMASARNGASHHEPAANFDRRSHAATNAASRSAKSPAAAARDSDEATLRSRIKHVRVDRDELTGAPVFVGSPHGFLTEPDGAGPAIPAMSRRATSNDPQEVVKAFVDAYPGLFGHGSDTLTAARVARDYVTAHNGMRTINWEQVVDGIRVFEAGFQAHITRRNELVNVSGRMIPNPEQAAEHGGVGRSARVALPSVTARAAVVLAAANLGAEMAGEELVEQTRPEGAEMRQQFQGPLLTDADVRYVWLPMDGETLRLCWEIICTTRSDGFMYRVIVDADTGEVQLRQSLTESISNASYRVFTSDSPSPFSPGLATPSTYQPPLVPRTLVTTAALNPIASPNGWIDDGVMETRGNNVDAHTDIDANNVADLPRPQAVGPDRVFDPPLDLTQEPSTYRDAAVVNLFYWCNWMHDKLYELGFTEAAGNFQVNNFGRGGIGNDPLQADAQDGSGTNNANFSTPPDGTSPRMQMFLWVGPTPDRDGDFDHEVVLHEYAHGLSNRLVGGGTGMSALASRALGEGWSDFYGITLLAEPGDDVDGNWARAGYSRYGMNGTFFENYYYGGRRYPYSTNLTVNPLTFKDIDPTQASSHAVVPRSPIVGTQADEYHNAGEVWCVTLWEARANLIKKHGFAVGNQLMLQLATDGLKLTPANPNFIQARDAILQADLVDTGGANQSQLWSAFAKRGMGMNASAPVSSTTTGLVESFDIPDDLSVTPAGSVTVTGDVGGPFSAQTYTVTNTGTAELSWNAASTQAWLTLSPSSGILASGQTTTVTVVFNSNASLLSQGIYNDAITFTNVSSGRTHFRALTLLVAPPVTITSFSPAAIASGMSVVINGTGFASPATVRFNGALGTNVVVNSSNQITVNAPSSLTAGLITVTTPNGTATSPAGYTVSLAPVITGFTPSSGPEKRMITVTGFNFSGSGISGGIIRVDGVAVSSSSRSSTTLVFPIPVGATTGPITYETSQGMATSPADFVVASGAPPANDDFANAQVLTGSSGSVVGNLANATKEPGEPDHGGSSGGVSVWFKWTAPTSGLYFFNPYNGSHYGVLQSIYTGDSVAALTPVASGSAMGTFTRFTSSVVLNAVAGTTYAIALDGYQGTMPDYRLTWSPLALPTITSFTPSSGTAGVSSVSITGSGFVPGAAVTIGGAPASRITYNSATSISVNPIPANAEIGPGSIAVTTPAGTATSAGTYNVLPPPAPSISGFTPGSGEVGTLVGISGTNLSLGGEPPVVRFGGVPVTTFFGYGSSFISVAVPSGAITGPVSVQTAGGLATSSDNFVVTDSLPVISSFSPDSGLPGTSVTIVGSGFSSVNQVRFNGISAAFTLVSPGQITAIVPAGATTGQITVGTPTTTAFSPYNFVVTSISAPTITSFFPDVIFTGLSVTITGTNLGQATAVAFNGVSAAFVIDSDTQLRATVPLGPLSNGPISVTAPGGIASSATNFTYMTGPLISSFAPSTIAAGIPVVITGAGFVDVTNVFFNGVNANFVVDSPTQITATAPAGVTPGAIAVATPWGMATSPTNYVLSNGPIITGFTPGSGPYKRMVVVTGANFSGAGVTSRTIKLNGMSVTSSSVSSTRFTFPVPVGATTGRITMQTNFGTATSATDFVVTGGIPPINDNFSNAQPLSGESGTITVDNVNATKEPGEPRHGNSYGGASVWYRWTAPSTGAFTFRVLDGGISMGTVQGVYVGDAVDALASVAQGSTASPYSNYGSTVAFNAVANTTYSIAIDGYEGLMGTFQLTWSPLASPAIASFTGSAYPGQSISIMGGGFVPGSVVSVGSTTIEPSNLLFSSSSQLVIQQLPLGANGPIIVSTVAGAAVSETPIVVLPPPPLAITSLSATSGQIGSSLTITGTALSLAEPMLPIVRFSGGAVATITSQKSGSLVVRVPTDAVTGPITAQTSQGIATSATSFTVLSGTPPPYVFGFTPATGPIGTVVTINGANYTGVTSVQLNGASVPFAINSANQITVTIPVGATSGTFRTIAGSASATSATSFQVTTPPSITGFAPTAVTSGMSVVISGANFSGVTGVAFNGVSAAFAVNSNTQITATVPSGALVPGPITVTTLDGVSSSAMSFTIAADTPSITSFTPAVLSSRQQVVITGANFNDVVSVFFNGMPGSFTVDSSSRITVVAPAGVTAGSIVVTTTKGSATAPILYTIAAPAVPSISDFSPAAIASGLAVTINGAGFSNVTSVRFNGVSANYVVLSPNQLVATAPSSLTAGPITVTTSLGTTSSATAYTLTLAPIITSFTPTSAPVNRVISVSGANFSGGSISNVVVRINGVQVLSQSRSGNTITFPIPVGATTGPITVTTNQGTAISAASLVVESGPPPANDSFANARIISGTTGFTSGNTANATKEFGEPNHGGNPGGASVWFTWTAPVSGFYLFNPYDASSSQFGILQSIYTGDSLNALTLVASGQPATSVFARFGSAAVLNATAGVTYRIALDGYNGVMANYRLTWTPLSPPFITSFNPTSAAAGQTLNVSVSGSGFAPGAIVSLGGAQVDPARITYSSSGSLTISQIPANAVTGPITVTTVAGTATSVSNFVIILPAPTITSFPTGAAVGATITITGTNFGGTLAVKFNGIDAVGFTVDPSGQTITATVPVGATTGPISVVTPGGTAVSSVPFIVVTPPVITQQPVSQTATVGETVSFTVSATSNGPLEYWWLKDGKPLLTNPTADHATLVLTNITAADTGVYVCQVGNTAAILKTIPATLTVNKATATVTLSGLTATYDGTPKPVPATTVPSNLQVQITYNGSATPPTNAGSYAVAAEIIDPNYFGSTTGTLLVNPALATVTFSGLSAVFDGTPRAVTVVTVPAGLAVTVTYNGSTTPPTNVGSYAVAATVINPNYAGGATDTQTIKPASASIALANLVQGYDGTPRPVTVTTTPAGLATTVTYNGSTVAPNYPGTFAVAAAIDDPNYSGSTTGSLVISATVTVRHAPALNGGIDGSLQVLLPEPVVLNGDAWISNDLLVPGTPSLLLNGHPVLVGTKDATGNMNPSSFQVVLNGNAALRYLVRRVDAIALPVVTPPPAPAGGRNVALNNARDLVGDFATLRDLTLNGNAGEIVVPPGTYGRFTANAHTAFVLGIPGASEPAIYNLQSLTLNGAAELKVVGPVVVTVADNVIAAGDLGDFTHPQWLTLRVATGGVTLNGVANLAGEVLAPNGSVVIGSGKIVGNVTADRLTLNGNGVIEQRPQ